MTNRPSSLEHLLKFQHFPTLDAAGISGVFHKFR